MKTHALQTQGRTLIARCHIARDFWSRFRGLMGRSTLPEDEGILFPRCNSIHTFFMRIPIDVVRIEQDGRVLDVQTVAPWRMTAPSLKTKHILEIRAARAGELGIVPGMVLKIEGVWG